MTKEQQNAIDDMLHKNLIITGKQIALSFFEKRLGVVNTHVIDFRKSLENDRSNFRELQEKCQECGAIDELMKLV